MILDLFAGPGGWSEGLRSLGLCDFGIEWDDAACATRYAAGHATWQADVEQVDAGVFSNAGVAGLIASPPCQDFSLAGKRAGIEGESGRLVWEPMRFIEALRPRWVAMEQVPSALQVWKAYRSELAALGYSAWCGVLNAADYGVPQTRERAILLASLDRPAVPPGPTHAKEPEPSGLFGGGRERWVSMADALGWPRDVLVEYQRGAGMVERHGERPGRTGDEPCFTLRAGAYGESFNFRVLHTNRGQDEGGARQTVPLDRPAPTYTAKSGGQWCWERPSTTLTTQHGPHNGWRKGESQSTHRLKITIQEALILQGFPPDYPVQGNKTKQSEQVGNAVPPPLAAALIGSLTASRMEHAA